jgi:hypothetical protein
MAWLASRNKLSAKNSKTEKGVAMTRKLFQYGGIAASIVLIAFGAGSIAIGAWGINNVRDNLKAEQIYFGDHAQDPAVPADLSGKQVTTGSQAREFAQMMRTHALESTSGQTYAQMGRFIDKNGNPTSDEAQAAKDPKTGTAGRERSAEHLGDRDGALHGPERGLLR